MKSIDIAKENKRAWNNVYAGAPRLRYPDTWFIHFLMRYTNWKTAKRGLYVGCGDAGDAFAMAELGLEVDCTDISEESIARVNQFAIDDGFEGRVRAHLGDQRKLDFADNTFDIAGSWSVISYLNKAEGAKAIAEIYRTLKPGGCFIGILESTDHTCYLQEGVKHIEGKTYQMPSEPNQTKADLVMTFYDRQEVDEMLKAFSKVTMSHRLIHLPPDAKRKVGQWAFCCVK